MSAKIRRNIDLETSPASGGAQGNIDNISSNGASRLAHPFIAKTNVKAPNDFIKNRLELMSSLREHLTLTRD